MTGVRPPFTAFGHVQDGDAPIESLDDLAAFHAAGCKPPERHRVGVEAERLPLLADGQAAPFPGADASVESLLRFLARRLDLEMTLVGAHVLGLSGPDFAVHLEPGAQVELALAPHPDATTILPALQSWREALVEAAEETGVHVVALGLQPVTPVPAIRWVPKDRYVVMRDLLGRRGRLAHHMMKATASVQVGVDYASEADCGERLRAALALTPLVNAFCVNSPLEGGRPNGFLSKRPQIWLETDPQRVGLLPWVFDEPFTFRRWVEWAMSVPPLFVMRDGQHVLVAASTFGEFVERGDEAAGRATHGDYQLHVTTLFPEVRLKQHLEVRGQDACSIELTAALAALWDILLRDPVARRDAVSLVGGLRGAALEHLHLDVGLHGLRAHLRTGEVRVACGELLQVAGRAATPAEDRLLDPLRAVVEGGETPAEALLREWAEQPGPGVLLSRL